VQQNDEEEGKVFEYGPDGRRVPAAQGDDLNDRHRKPRPVQEYVYPYDAEKMERTLTSVWHLC
jgi:hypothetical protein